MDRRQACCAPVALVEGLNSRGLVIPLTDSGVSPLNVAEWAKGYSHPPMVDQPSQLRAFAPGYPVCPPCRVPITCQLVADVAILDFSVSFLEAQVTKQLTIQPGGGVRVIAARKNITNR